MRAYVYVLDRMGISRQQMADLLEIDPSSVSTHKEKLKDDTTKSLFDEELIYQLERGIDENTLRMHISYSPRKGRLTDDLNPKYRESPEYIAYVELDVESGDHQYILQKRESGSTKEQIPQHTAYDSVHGMGMEPLSFREDVRCKTYQTTQIEYDDPVMFAYDFPNVHTFSVYEIWEVLSELPVFTMDIEDFIEQYLEYHALEVENFDQIDSHESGSDLYMNSILSTSIYLAGDSIFSDAEANKPMDTPFGREFIIGDVIHLLSAEYVAEAFDTSISVAEQIQADVADVHDDYSGNEQHFGTDRGLAIWRSLRDNSERWHEYAMHVVDGMQESVRVANKLAR